MILASSIPNSPSPGQQPLTEPRHPNCSHLPHSRPIYPPPSCCA
ncbi:unnamed protein product [Nezara viridula]|uniref:Uncharacterized protein n=1 Tax=Nezara viridula TaxID=85310 RepID=A0A9P0GYX2_NEZVI|nr:unnamed protein product [Nezara viridula]